ncbi:MAG TPA: cytochrome P450 [Acidobacteriaceae bacterium]
MSASATPTTAGAKAAPNYPPPDIRADKGGRYPAGPGLLKPLLSGRVFRQAPGTALTQNAVRFGDLVHYRAAGRHIYQFSHPELIQEMLVGDARHHHRGMVMQRSKLVLGEGLLTSEEPLHMRQRRLAQPAFHRDRIAAYGRVIGRYAAEATAAWLDGTTRDVHADMQTLALRIVGRTLFDEEMIGDTARIAAAIDAYMAFLPLVFLPLSSIIQRLPIPLMNRIHRSRIELDTLIYRLIAERRRLGIDRGDLLSMLLASEDTEEDSGSMSDAQVRDECVTTLLAGNETTANALSFALWLLAAHPAEQESLYREAAEVLGDTTLATAEHYPLLPYAHMCFAEAMRLYPPVWVTARTAAVSYECRGFTIPAGSILLAPQFVVHADPRWWEEPERFDPTRFREADRAGRPKMSYFPFGAGGRQCIGEGLAWMEGVLSLATIARDWRLSLPAGAAPALKIKARITLRPDGPLPLQLHRRRAG